MTGIKCSVQVPILGDLIMSGALAHLDNVHHDLAVFTTSDTVKEEVWLKADKRNNEFR